MRFHRFGFPSFQNPPKAQCANFRFSFLLRFCLLRILVFWSFRTFSIEGSGKFHVLRMYRLQDSLIVTLRDFSSVQTHTSQMSGLTVFIFSGFRSSLQSHTSENSVFTVSTFSGCLVSVESHISSFRLYTVFTFCGCAISVKFQTSEISVFTVFAFSWNSHFCQNSQFQQIGVLQVFSFCDFFDF